jgi:acetylglutamate kinase
MRDPQTFVQHLSEALPYLQRFRGKTIVIKYGGAAMDREDARRAFIKDMVLLRTVGIKPVIVHGGGPMITEMLKKIGKTTQFIEGLRVTDKETVNITEMVLAGIINKGIVAEIQREGGRAVGISGKDGNLVEAVKHKPSRPGVDPSQNSDGLDIGFVGDVRRINPEVLESLDEAGFIPVVAPLGGGDDGETYNINADTVAGAIAGALRAEKFILMTDTPGLLRDAKDPDTLISSLSLSDLDNLISDGTISGGMIPKTAACRRALDLGCRTCHIIDGRVPHSALLEVFTDEGVGTLIAS